MAKKSTRQPLQIGLPFHLNAQARVYLPICDDNPYAAYLLAYCFEQKVISEYKYAEKQAQEEADLAALTEEEREQVLLDRVDEGYDRYLDRLLNEYNGDAWLNDEDDAVEGRDGYFDLDLHHVKEELLQKTRFSTQLPTDLEERSAVIQEKLREALHLLYKRGYLRHVWLCDQLNEQVLEESMEEAYPALFQRYRDKEQQRRRETGRVHHHLHMARKYGLSATLTLEEWLATLAHFHWKCAYCQHAPYTVLEHFEPVIAGGGTTRYNCVPACDECNLGKQGLHPDHIPTEYGMDEGIARVRSYLASLRQQALEQRQKRRAENAVETP